MTGHAVAAMLKMMGKFKKDRIHIGKFWSKEEKLYFVLFKHSLRHSAGKKNYSSQGSIAS
jgi:hypothetical protein